MMIHPFRKQMFVNRRLPETCAGRHKMLHLQVIDFSGAGNLVIIKIILQNHLLANSSARSHPILKNDNTVQSSKLLIGVLLQN